MRKLMADLIQLLPDAIANQIAAGEVIQRPASVVKELMENSIDAGSTNIKLIVKDAGKTLIQVIDNGCGMSETDARLSFERHATSKIREAQDLFAIRTMGFRGEALASIAAVAQVEMRTRRKADELGSRIVIEGSEVKVQEPCQCASGTNLAVKNLFFNVPARRNFLKSNTVEMRHVLDEFQRIALANPDIFFSLHHNNSEVFHLPAGNLAQRIIALFGKNYNKRLVRISEETDVLRIDGYVGKPEHAKKNRGEQFLFVNHRFIRSSYLHHAIAGAYEDLLPSETYPFFVLFIDIDPARIDINVHPTKQEIKFEDERLVYNYLKVAVRHGLGRNSITPSLDFDQEYSFSSTRISPPSSSGPTIGHITRPASPSEDHSFSSPSRKEARRQQWEKLFEGLDAFDPAEGSSPEISGTLTIESEWSEENKLDDTSGSFSRQQKEPYQIHSSYIVSHIKSGFLLIDQQAAHERILYERYLKALREQAASAQNQLFPRTVTVSPTDTELMKEIAGQVSILGFDIQELGGNTFVINSVPADIAGKTDEVDVVESLLHQYKSNLELKLESRESIARAMAKSASIKRGQLLGELEMQTLIDKLFACEMPFKSPSGRKCFITFELDELNKRFES